MWALLDRRGRIVGFFGPRTVLEIGSIAAMLAIAVDDAPPGQRWPGLVLAVMAALAMTLPDTEAGLVTLLGYGAWWIAADRGASWIAVLLVAVAGLIFHLALAQGAAAPSGAVTEWAVVRSLARNTLVVLAALGGVALLVAAADARSLQTPAFLIGIALVVIVVVPWMALMGESASESTQPSGRNE